MNITIVCADWGKEPVKRRAWELRAGSRVVRPVAMQSPPSLQSLLGYCTAQSGRVLLGIDAAIGVPRHVVERFREGEGRQDAGFTQWIQWLFAIGDPFNPCHHPLEWHYGRPFIEVPGGKGSKQAFPKSGIVLHRDIEYGLGANSPLIVSGIPGTVGSGSRALWQEISCSSAESTGSGLSIWPFSGPMDSLLATRQTTIAEIYPKACYGIALAETLPAPLLSIAKTRVEARAGAIQGLLPRINGVLTIEALDRCLASEDDFDAMISVVAIARLVGSGLSLDPAYPTDAIEGDILGKTAIDLLSKPGQPMTPLIAPATLSISSECKPSEPPKMSSQTSPLGKQCPIPGCGKIFMRGRLGWDAHVASLRIHPNWHPDISDGHERKRIFCEEFPGFFQGCATSLQ